MNSFTSFEKAKEIMGVNIISPNDLSKLKGLYFTFDKDYTIVPFSIEEIRKKSKDYLLIYGCSRFLKNQSVTIMNLKSFFGDNPEKGEPCFYFQDWYNKEDFVNLTMDEGWFFIRKNVYEESRRILPDILEQRHHFPSAIRCVFSFFVTWLVLKEKLWYHDFVWCNDVDHNGDRIYVGKYNDVDGINKNGFSIHRHLSLRHCYGCVDYE